MTYHLGIHPSKQTTTSIIHQSNPRIQPPLDHYLEVLKPLYGISNSGKVCFQDTINS